MDKLKYNKRNLEIILRQNKTKYRLLYDCCVVCFIYIITVHHMYDSDYTLLRMTRFWTYFGMWSCGVYFFINFLRQLSLLLLSELTIKSHKEFLRQKDIRLIHFVVEFIQQTAVSIAISVSLMFWILYFKSPSTVFRATDEWQPTLFEEWYYTHFEHTFPLIFLLIDCFFFKQGNTRVHKIYFISKYGPYSAFLLYSSITLYDFHYYNIKPYPFMDNWNIYALLSFIMGFLLIFKLIFNPCALLIRYYLKLLSNKLFNFLYQRIN
ncbi:hypothetical protein CL6EHI_191790 [Entamoeba histolytica]|nr:hypothetical protein CL6EHI_191790 [Entamoeba histolytica]